MALSDPQSTVVNDMIAGVPVTVTYNHWHDKARAFTAADLDQSLAMGLKGWTFGTMYLSFRGQSISQEEADIPGLTSVKIDRQTWLEWKSKHPDTDVFTGMKER
jgi:hypothetical protein